MFGIIFKGHPNLKNFASRGLQVLPDEEGLLEGGLKWQRCGQHGPSALTHGLWNMRVKVDGDHRGF